MPDTYYIENLLHLEEGSVKNLEFLQGSLHVHIELSHKPHTCPCCGSITSLVKDYRLRKIFLGFISNLPHYAFYNQRRYLCPNCCKSFPESCSFVSKYQRQSNYLQKCVISSCTEKFSFTSIAKHFHLNISTVMRCFSKVSFPKPAQLPSVISLDEFKGNAGKQKFQVIFTNPADRKIMDILPKRDTQEMIKYFRGYTCEMRKKVDYVVMDMSRQFRKVAEECFPNARIIADRFHVYRCVLWAMENVRKREQKKLSEKSNYLKRNKKILCKRSSKLTEMESIKLAEICRNSADLRKAYWLKECFYKVTEISDAVGAEEFLIRWLKLVKESGLEEFRGLLKSFREWKGPIIAALTMPYSNGYTEGCNNKIKVLKRISFGIKDFNRFRNRILLME